jgi:hypothetical protein
MTQQEDKLRQSKKTTTTTVATNPLPTAQGVDYQYSQRPFKYEPGQSVLDIMSQAKVNNQMLEDEQARATRMAKIAAFTDFFRSLGNLAGGGYAPIQLQQSSPYLQQAFQEADNARRQRLQSDIYYNEQERKARQEDYNQQLKYHQDTEKERNKYGYEAAKIKADQQFKAGLEGFKAGQQKQTTEYVDPTELNLKKRQVEIQAENAQSNRIRAEKSGMTKAPFLEFKGKKMDISGAQQLVNEVISRYGDLANMTDLEAQKLSPLEKEIRSDISNLKRTIDAGDIERSNNAIRAVALKYLAKDTKGEFDKYFQDNSGSGSFLEGLIDDERDYSTGPSLLQ